MNKDQLNEAAKLLAQDEDKYIEFISNYCIENNVNAESTNNAVAFGKCLEIPYYMDSKVENRIKEIKRG